MTLGKGTGRNGKTGLVTRPIEREVWSRDALAAEELAINQRTKLTAARSAYNDPISAPRSSGAKVSGGASTNGGTFSPAQSNAGANGTTGST